MRSCKPEQRLERGHRRAASVEPERELVQIGLQVLGVHAMVGSAEPCLEVAEDAMHARQDDVSASGPTLRRGMAGVAHAGQRGVALPAIGDHDRAGLDVGADEPD